MAQRPAQTGSFVFGGLLVGMWLYIAMFGVPDEPDLINEAAWMFWGVLGLALGGGVYAGRVTEGVARISILVALGIVSGLILMAAILQAQGEAWAAAFTFLGAALIVSGLPGPAWVPANQAEGTAQNYQQTGYSPPVVYPQQNYAPPPGYAQESPQYEEPAATTKASRKR